MIEHPDFLNVRKLTIVLATGPFMVLALLAAIDFSWHQFTSGQTSTVRCAQVALDSPAQPSNRDCQP